MQPVNVELGGRMELRRPVQLGTVAGMLVQHPRGALHSTSLSLSLSLSVTRFAEQASGMVAGKSCPCAGRRMPHAETTHTHTQKKKTPGTRMGGCSWTLVRILAGAAWLS